MGTPIKPFEYDTLDAVDRRLLRDIYVKAQDGNCSHCGYPLDGKPPLEILDLDHNPKRFPSNFLDHLVHLHHDHDTGLTIGAIHARCNAALWEHHGE